MREALHMNQGASGWVVAPLMYCASVLAAYAEYYLVKIFPIPIRIPAIWFVHCTVFGMISIGLAARGVWHASKLNRPHFSEPLSAIGILIITCEVIYGAFMILIRLMWMGNPFENG